MPDKTLQAACKNVISETYRAVSICLTELDKIIKKDKKDHPVKYFFKVTIPDFIDLFRRPQ